ncbi:hypothetical protein [Streptomyces sp. NPDC048611]|uniref:hypothetical protein n=1 Tax=Streptomyces sp. NPDC048611 TaxID=3155635 RepID=UPI00341EF9B4
MTDTSDERRDRYVAAIQVRLRDAADAICYDPEDAAADAATAVADAEQRALRAELDDALASIKRVRSVHRRREGDSGSTYCEPCSNHGDIQWPCATIRALEPPKGTR